MKGISGNYFILYRGFCFDGITTYSVHLSVATPSYLAVCFALFADSRYGKNALHRYFWLGGYI